AAYNQRDHGLLAVVLYGQRLNLKHPPTAVGGIPGAATPLSCRLSLNNPPTAVGGIARKFDAHLERNSGLPDIARVDKFAARLLTSVD
ncbi:MAG TPA: hypothetical protein VKF81_00725, partial [Blastocatellia bacterium]|nr:hypothetical protein [Blastocatellia bacterium]